MSSSLLVANWKMNYTSEQTVEFLKQVIGKINLFHGTQLIICPPFTSLSSASHLICDTPIELGAQTLNHHNDGPYTGEISPQMIAEFCNYVILGHSERRLLFNETNHEVNLKALAAIQASLHPIICIDGQSDINRESKYSILSMDELHTQIGALIKDIPNESKFILAYEPTWAVGSGKPANPSEVNIIASAIREIVINTMGSRTGKSVPILYGGSVSLDNIKDYCALPDINGVLVGGASLDPEQLILLATAIK